MSRSERSQSTVAVTTTYLFVSLGFVIRNYLPTGWPGWLLWIVCFGISVFLLKHGTDWLWNRIVLHKGARKKILGHTWIEGTWLVQTFEYSDGVATEVQRGMGEFGYELPGLSLSCQVTSILLPSLEPVETTVTCIILADDLHYLHSFERYVMGVEEKGAAYGKFIHHAGKTPDRYRGGVVILNRDDACNRNQIGRKLTDQEIREAQIKYGKEGWRQRALMDAEWVKSHGSAIQSSSP